MPVAGPFYFAWVDETETTFGTEHHRMDEYVFEARRVLAEGEKPKLVLEIENPYEGLLSPLRKQWAWFAWDDGTTIHPLFFGRLVGIPSELQGETITITLIAWPSNYKKQLQALAETMKVAPFYDPVFTDVAHRDDPMALFESYSKVIVVDPVTLVVSASDILEGEDGNVDFTADDHFYPSLHVSPGTVPKTAVHVDASVSWTQTAHGYLDLVNDKATGMLADGIISDWPKPGASLANGIHVFNSAAIDVSRTASIETTTISGSWTNKEKHHEDGDTLSLSWSLTTPTGIPATFATVVSVQSQPGFLDPFAVDADGDPSPTNIPASINAVLAWSFSYTAALGLTIEYQAARPHTERIIFTLQANVQPTTLDPLVTEDSETLTISGSDVGVPIIDLLNWTTISGTHVDVGTVIFPDDPALPGGTSAQVAVVAGTAGAVEPEFSDVVGETTVDGGVTWASLGVTAPTENAINWSGVSHVPTGTVILPQRPLFITWQAFTAVTRNAALTGAQTTAKQSASEGTIIQSSNGSFQVCTLSGDCHVFTEPSFSTTWGAVTVDGNAEWTSLGMTLPAGSTYFIATTGGLTGAIYVIPPFGAHSTLHDTVTDGTVTWTCIGTGDVPIGGVPGNVTSSTYFATDRGQRSIAHLICRARARLRYASRCVSLQYECDYARGIELTTRKTATLHDPRLPGGLVAGKITHSELVASGGQFTCSVGMMAAVGFAETIEELPGDPTYVDDGYVEDGYQVRTGMVVLVPTLSDVAYSPIVPVPDEDGITFPLTSTALVVSQGVRGATAAAQQSAIYDATVTQRENQDILQGLASTGMGNVDIITGGIPKFNPLKDAIDQNQMWYEMVMRPLNGNGSFNHVYHLKCSMVEFPQMINLMDEGSDTVRRRTLRNLFAPLISSLDTFFAPALTGGVQTLQPALIGGGDTFAVPIVTRSGGSVTAPTISSMRPVSAASSVWDVSSGGTSRSNNLNARGSSAYAGATVIVYVDNVSIGSTTTDGSGNWSMPLGILSDASHSVKATVTSGGNTSGFSSTFTFTVGANITGFTNHVDSIFLINGFQFQVQATGSAGSAGPSYSVQSADSHSFRLETRPGDKYYGTDTGHAVDRNELSAGGSDTRGINNRVFRTTFEALFEAGAVSTATDWCIFYQIHGEAGGVSPPFSMQLCGPSGHFTAGDHLLFTSQYWTPAAGSLTNAHCTTVDHYVSPANIVRGVWHQFEVEFYPDNAGGGHIYVWLDGVQVVNYTGNVGYGGPPNNAFYYPSIDGVYRGPTPISDTQAVQFRNFLHKILLV